jgi:Lipase (class 3)
MMPEPTELNDLVAAQLSVAAYVPVAEYAYQSHGPELPAGWQAVPWLSSWGGPAGVPDKHNQMVTFVNEDRKRMVHAFKGSNNFNNFYSDIRDEGYSQWRQMMDACDRIHLTLTSPNARGPQDVVEMLSHGTLSEQKLGQHINRYKGFKRYVTGHSLGGGMAQVAAVRYGLSGYTQNALPIPRFAQMDNDYFNNNDPHGQPRVSFREAWGNWYDKNADRKLFMRSNKVDGDIATFYYSNLRGLRYLNDITINIPFPKDAQNAIATSTNSRYCLAEYSNRYRGTTLRTLWRRTCVQRSSMG